MGKSITHKSNAERKKFVELYDLFNSFKKYDKEVNFLKRFIKKQFGSKKIRLLDVGCGTLLVILSY